MSDQVGRNDPCPCGSGKKYKSCCLGKPQLLKQHRFSVLGKDKEKKEAEPPVVLMPNLMDRIFGEVPTQDALKENLLIVEAYPEVAPPPRIIREPLAE